MADESIEKTTEQTGNIEKQTQKPSVPPIQKMDDLLDLFSLTKVLNHKEYILAVILISSFAKLYLYYTCFGIYIFNFISLSDCTVIFMGEIVTFSIATAFYIPALKLISDNNKRGYVFLVAVGTLVEVFFGVIRNGLLQADVIVTILLIWFFAFALQYIEILFFNKPFEKKMERLPSRLALLLFLFALSSGAIEIMKVKWWHYNQTFIVKTNDGVNLTGCSCTNTYIGKTGSYVFIWDNESKTTAYDIEDIKSITFSTKDEYSK